MKYYSKLDYRFLKTRSIEAERNRIYIDFLSNWVPVSPPSHKNPESKEVQMYLDGDVGGGSIPPLLLEGSTHFLNNHIGNRDLPTFIKTVEALTDSHYPQFNKVIERRYLIDPYTKCGSLFKITCRSQNGTHLARWVTPVVAHTGNVDPIDPSFCLLIQIISYLIFRLSQLDETLGRDYQNNLYSTFSNCRSSFKSIFGFEYSSETLIDMLRYLIDNVNSEREHSRNTYLGEIDRIRDTIDSLTHYIHDGLGTGFSYIEQVIGNDGVTYAHLNKPIPMGELVAINPSHRIDYAPSEAIVLNPEHNRSYHWLMNKDILDAIESTHLTDAKIIFHNPLDPARCRVEIVYEICRYAPYLFPEEWDGESLRGKEQLYQELCASLVKAMMADLFHPLQDSITRIVLMWNYDDEGAIMVWSDQTLLFQTLFDFNVMTFLTPVVAVDDLTMFVPNGEGPFPPILNMDPSGRS